MKKYLYSGALALAAILTLSACAKPKLDAKLSVNDIVYMSGSDLKLKDDQTLVEVSFTTGRAANTTGTTTSCDTG